MAAKRKRNPKRQMPPALKAYWAARNKRLRNPRRKAGARKRRRNPLPTQHILLAQRPGGPVLKYLGGIKFAQVGRPVKFASKPDAITVARGLRQQFRILKTYKLWAT